MRIFNSIAEFESEKKTVLTLGTFDGVHLGHRSILHKIISAAKESDCESLVLTFYPHPRMVLQQDSNLKLLNTIKEKSKLLDEFGVDNLVIHPFDKVFSELTAEEFVSEVLVKNLKVSKIIIGYDHRFGKGGSATINDLIYFGNKYHFEVEQISAREIDQVSVSSTKIRKALNEGDIELANSYLGYQYFFSGKVSKGKQLGRTIGFPTANILLADDSKLIPPVGVYVVYSFLGGIRKNGMMNIGFRPTVDGVNQTIEVHFFDFEGDLYGAVLEIHVLKRIRDEERFGSVEALRKQLEIDKEVSLDFFSNS